MREAAEQRLRKGNEVEEVVEEILIEGYIEDMEVDDIVLDGKGA